MFDLIKLKNNFNEIKVMRESVHNLLISLNDKVDLLVQFYKEILEKHINETSNGLDSFHFQSKLIKTELINSTNIFNIIDNRIYCDYYKLFKSIVKYLVETIRNKNLTNPFESKNYPIYKDLENKQSFNFDITIEIYNDIIQGCDILNNELISREHNLGLQKKKRDNGLNIDNLINSIVFNNSVLNNNIELFANYINVFNKFHIKYLTRFFLRTKLFYGQINSDIQFEESKLNITSNSLIDNTFSLNEEDEKNIRIIIDNKNESSEIIDSNNVLKELDIMLNGVRNSPEPYILKNISCTNTESSSESSLDISYNLVNEDLCEKDNELIKDNSNIIIKNNIDLKRDSININEIISDNNIEYSLNNYCNII